ncbi:MAG: universal stress protein [Thiotrichaceae bacterium]|nr:universal stress protein [Thiotrichaceae bacterium]
MLPDIQNILYATDISDNSRHVFRYALSVAKKYNAQVTLLNILEPLNTSGTALVEAYLSREGAKKIHQNMIEQARKQLQAQLETFCQAELHATTSESHLIADTLVIDGPAAQAIVKKAKETQTDLIIMGTHSLNPFSDFLIGSTAHKVTQLSPIPVLIVPLEK